MSDLAHLAHHFRGRLDLDRVSARRLGAPECRRVGAGLVRIVADAGVFPERELLNLTIGRSYPRDDGCPRQRERRPDAGAPPAAAGSGPARP